MNTSQIQLEKIERYLNNNFDKLVSSDEGIEIYSGLMEIRTQLQSEVSQLRDTERRRNSTYGRLLRMREEPVLKDIFKGKDLKVNECMKLSQFIPKLN